jgi:hypothetical protein
MVQRIRREMIRRAVIDTCGTGSSDWLYAGSMLGGLERLSSRGLDQRQSNVDRDSALGSDCNRSQLEVLGCRLNTGMEGSWMEMAYL